MIEAERQCPACGSADLVEHAVHDGTGWLHQLECKHCRHVLESISYLSHESEWASS